MGSFKYLVGLLLALAVVALWWRSGRAAFSGLTRWLLWALAALCACSGVVVLYGAERRPVALVSGFLLWAFAAYAIKVAGALAKRG